MNFSYGEKEISYLKKKDKKLGAVIDRLGHIERAVDADLFSAVVHHIIGQQISAKAQRTIWHRLEDALGEVSAETVGAADVSYLQSFGLSFRKAEYIKEFSEKVTAGIFDLETLREKSDEEAIEALCTIRGIGVWTAEMILLFCLQRPDVLSFGDLAVVRGMRMVYRHRVLTREKFETYRRRLSPYGSVAALYFWAVAGGAIPELTDPAPKKRK